MEVEYNLTFRDMEALSRYHHKHHTMRQLSAVRKKRMLWSVVLALPLAILTQVYFAVGGELPEIDIRWCIVFGCGFFLGILLFTVLIAKAFFIRSAVKQAYNNEESRWLFAPQRMRINAGGFSIISEYHHLSYSWAVVCEIGVTVDHAFFYTAQVQVHVLPGRAFRDRQHFKEFIDLARQYQQGHGPRELKSTGIITSLPPESTAITPLDAP